jgi:hypothetical protein
LPGRSRTRTSAVSTTSRGRGAPLPDDYLRWAQRQGASEIALATYVTFRYGLLALAVAIFADNLANSVPLTLHMSAWWAGPSNLTIALLIGLAAFAFYAARAGERMWNWE